MGDVDHYRYTRHIEVLPGYYDGSVINTGSITPLVRNTRRHLRDVDYDTMVGTGLSGALVVPELARRLKKLWFIVRKDSDRCHATTSYYPGVGAVGKRWIFVDDVIDTGVTLERVKIKMRTLVDHNYDRPWDTKYVGTYLYHYHAFREQDGWPRAWRPNR